MSTDDRTFGSFTFYLSLIAVGRRHVDHSSVNKSTDREQRPYEQAERHEKRGYSTKQSVCQGSQHKEPPSV